LKWELILWNIKDILIDEQPLFWKSSYEQKVIFINDLLSDTGGFLPFNQFKEEYNIKTNFLQYHQITSAIPSRLKQTSAEQPKIHYDFTNLFFLSENKSIIHFEEF